MMCPNHPDTLVEPGYEHCATCLLDVPVWIKGGQGRSDTEIADLLSAWLSTLVLVVLVAATAALVLVGVTR